MKEQVFFFIFLTDRNRFFTGFNRRGDCCSAYHIAGAKLYAEFGPNMASADFCGVTDRLDKKGIPWEILRFKFYKPA